MSVGECEDNVWKRMKAREKQAYKDKYYYEPLGIEEKEGKARIPK